MRYAKKENINNGRINNNEHTNKNIVDYIFYIYYSVINKIVVFREKYSVCPAFLAKKQKK